VVSVSNCSGFHGRPIVIGLNYRSTLILLIPLITARPREVARAGEVGSEKLHATLCAENISPFTSATGTRNEMHVYVCEIRITLMEPIPLCRNINIGI